MILRDRVSAVDTEGEILQTMRGVVSYRTVSLETAQEGPGYQITQQLTAITDPWEWDPRAHRLRFRHTDYRITGLLWRRRNGRDHHVTLDLEKSDPR